MYQLENVPVFEAIYGPGLISLGGYDAVTRMFDGILIRGKTLLDIGSGIGGMAHFLAKDYNARVIGLEIHPWMAEFAIQRMPSEERASFVCYSGHEPIPIASSSIDFVYSKGVLTNIENKAPLLMEVKRVLKPNGAICLVDWLTTDKAPKTEILPLGDLSRKETLNSYKSLLAEAGFREIDFKDVTPEYLGYVRELGVLLRSNQHKQAYSAIIDDSLREQLIDANNHLLAQLEGEKQQSFRITASASGSKQATATIEESDFPAIKSLRR